MYYIQKDHLGSYYCVTDENGDIVLLNDREEQIYSFDPWGRRRSPQTWDYGSVQKEFLFDRGFTGHEHLDKFDLINMNGRVYDPWVGRFLSPDIIVQSPQYSQSYNRYSYVFNNPLKYVDPTGYEGGPYGNPLPYAYGEGSASPGMGFYDITMGPRGQFYFGNKKNYQFVNSGHNASPNVHYNWFTQEYVDSSTGKPVSWSYTKSNYVEPNAMVTVSNLTKAWIGFFGTSKNPKMFLTGFSFSGEYNLRNYNTSQYNSLFLDWDGSAGGGDLANNGITLNETATGVSAIGFSNSVKGYILDWGMQGANWGKTGARYMKVVRGTGVAGSVFGMGVSGYNMYSDYSQGGINAVNGWDVSDFGVGAVGLTTTGLVTLGLVSNPVGWVIVGGVTIYFGARFVYDISTKP